MFRGSSIGAASGLMKVDKAQRIHQNYWRDIPWWKRCTFSTLRLFGSGLSGLGIYT
jgi:hypothetical protein